VTTAACATPTNDPPASATRQFDASIEALFALPAVRVAVYDAQLRAFVLMPSSFKFATVHFLKIKVILSQTLEAEAFIPSDDCVKLVAFGRRRAEMRSRLLPFPSTPLIREAFQF
jgi:hypothetical protein